MEFRILGPVEVWHAGQPVPIGAPKERAVLAGLALEAPRVVAIDTLIDQVWGLEPPATARVTMRNYVRRLRRRMPEHVVETQAPGYRLRVDPDSVDALRFQRLVASAQAILPKDPDAAAAELTSALELWRGPPLSNVGTVPLCQMMVPRLCELHATAIEDWAEARLRVGRSSEAAAKLVRLIEDDPLRERAYGMLMLALYRGSRQAAALDIYEAIRSRLADELGVDPGPDLQQLRQQILNADPSLLLDNAGGPRSEPEVQGRRRAVTAEHGPRPAVAARPGQLPAAVPAFTGRIDYVSQLDRLGTVEDVTVVTITGTAGVGKTALAVHWAHRVREAFPDGQLYVDLRGYAPTPPMHPLQALARFLHALGVPADQVPLDVDEGAAFYRSLLVGRRLLVLLDNAGDPEQIRPLLPGSPGCLALVTSRDSLAGLVALDGAHCITLDVMSAAEALELLGRLLGPDRITAEPEAADDLAELCAYLPLALRIAAANFIIRQPLSLSAFTAQMRADDRLAALAVEGDAKAAARSAFDLSYAGLAADAQRLFRRLGLVPGTDVTIDAAAALTGLPVPETEHLLARLVAAHLVGQRAPGRYTSHDLLRRYASDLAITIDGADVCQDAAERLLRHYLRNADAAARLLYPQMLRLPLPAQVGGTNPGFDTAADALAWLDAERSNLVAATQSAAARTGGLVWLLADALRGYFWLRRHTVDWVDTATAARAASRTHRQPQPEAAAELSLGLAHYSQTRLHQAREHYAAALRLSHRAGWLPGKATALGNLGNVYADMGKLALAARLQTRALALNRVGGRPAQAANLNSLGAVYWQWGKLADAADHYAEALDLHRSCGSSTGEALTLVNLGEVWHALGRLREAQEALVEALRLCRLAGMRDCEADALDNLAALERDLGQPLQAVMHAQRARDIAREISDRRTEAEALSTLGSTQLRLGGRQEALDHYRLALRLAGATANRYPFVAALIGLAAAHRHLGDPRRAASRAQHAIAIAQQAEFRVLEALGATELAAVHLDRDENGLAIRHSEQALAGHRTTGHVLGQAVTHRILAAALSQHDPAGARTHLAAALDLYARAGVPDACEIRDQLPLS